MKPSNLSPVPMTLFQILRYGPGFARVFVRLLRDNRVSMLAKLVPLLAVAWWVSFIDLDWIPFVGYLDDLAVLILSARLFIRMCPKHVVAEHVAAVEGKARP